MSHLQLQKTRRVLVINLLKDTVGGLLWLALFDAVHHRGQLTTYIRPMGGKVPSVYGPSADDSGM